jgi:hypothetical protein
LPYSHALSSLARLAGQRSRKPGCESEPIEAMKMQRPWPVLRVLHGAVWLAVALLAACSPQRDKTPLPTKQTTIDPVMKKLDAAGAQADKRREEMEAASK